MLVGRVVSRNEGTGIQGLHAFRADVLLKSDTSVSVSGYFLASGYPETLVLS